jgi:hypothetical protein
MQLFVGTPPDGLSPFLRCLCQPHARMMEARNYAFGVVPWAAIPCIEVPGGDHINVASQNLPKIFDFLEKHPKKK